MAGIGISLPNRGVLFGAIGVDELVELAVRADESGWFASVWVGDGLIVKARLESVTTLAAIAARTSRVRLGVCCLASFALRQPTLFALQWASLDVLSGGRTQLAVCLGTPTGRWAVDFDGELAAMGVGKGERRRRFEENLAIVRGLWAGEFAYDGEFTSFPAVELEPRPIQQPCPVWIASNPNPDLLSPANYQRAIDRVGRLGDGWQSTTLDPSTFRERWNDILESAAAAGRDPEAMESSVHLMINVSDDEAAARAEAKRFIDTYYPIDVDDETMDQWGAFGPAEQVLARILEYVEAGMDVPALRFASFNQTEQMDRSSELLLPELARHFPDPTA